MDKLEIYQVDAFTDKVFHGNSAAICLLNEWLNDELLQAIAVENNLSETAFVIEDPDGYQIRWFTPNGEIDLCGHATLAAAFILYELGKCNDLVHFSCRSGPLVVRQDGERLVMDFPRLDYELLVNDKLVREIINKPILDAYLTTFDYLVELESEADVSNAQVDIHQLAKLEKRGLIITARSHEADFYSRCFYPKHHIPEDPVTGSAHCVLAPFWAEKLKKTKLKSIQGSYRKGEVFCEVTPNRVLIAGSCRWFLKGHILI